MAIAFRSSGTFSAGAVDPSPQNLTVSLPTGHASGDLLLMHISQGVTTAMSAPAGWTLASGSASWTGTGTRWTGLMWKWDGGSESNPAVSYTAGATGGCWGVISAFSGVGVKANPFNITPASGAASGTTKTGAAMTSTVANCMPVWFFQNGDNGVFNAATSPAVAMYNGASYDSVVGIDTSMAAIYKPPIATGTSGTGVIACASGEVGFYIGVMLDPTVVTTGPTRLFQPF